MRKIEYVDDPTPGNAKYPQLLAQIKGEQLASTRHRGMWALIGEFNNEGTARDLAYRLGRTHDEFTFSSRKGEEGTTRVYAQLKEGVE
jgi:hypothetical protein